MSGISYSSAAELGRRIREGQLSSREVLDHLLDRIEHRGKVLNAVVTFDVDDVRKQADEADRAPARGEIRGPLHGVHMTIKDTLETAGIRTTAGFPPFTDHISSSDATVVARMRAAGAIVFGKTNVAVLARDSFRISPIFSDWSPSPSPRRA